MKLVKVGRQLGLSHILWCGPEVWVEWARRARIVRDVQEVLDLDNRGMIDFGHIQLEICNRLADEAFPEHKLIAADLLGCCVGLSPCPGHRGRLQGLPRAAHEARSVRSMVPSERE